MPFTVHNVTTESFKTDHTSVHNVTDHASKSKKYIPPPGANQEGSNLPPLPPRNFVQLTRGRMVYTPLSTTPMSSTSLCAVNQSFLAMELSYLQLFPAIQVLLQPFLQSSTLTMIVPCRSADMPTAYITKET